MLCACRVVACVVFFCSHNFSSGERPRAPVFNPRLRQTHLRHPRLRKEGAFRDSWSRPRLRPRLLRPRLPRPRLLQPQLLHPRLRPAKLRHPRLRNDGATKARLQRQGAILDSFDQPRPASCSRCSTSWDRQRLPAMENTHRFIVHELGECV